jgi:hypothetical protein
VRAELKSLDSADAPEGLASYRPTDPANFVVQVGAIIGPAGEEGEEIFYFQVCSPQWLGDNPPPKGFEFLRAVVMPRWDHSLLVRALEDLCRRTEGRNWNEIATKLTRHAHWEFEDYKEG